jgi:hypothetical protein
MIIMPKNQRRVSLVSVAGTVAVAALAASALITAVATQPAASLQIPEGLRAEHEAIHSALEQATRAPGRVGEAAAELARVLHPHFERENQIALPPLGLLAALARGARPADEAAALEMTDALKAEMPRMLAEHQEIRVATMRLRNVARAEGAAAVEHLAEELAAHAQMEEDVMYPAAILVGDVIRARSQGK